MITCEFENGNIAHPGLRHVVADVLVTKDDHLLLAKRAEHLLDGGKWALPGGYVDRGETMREAAEREVLEETGWQIEELMLFRINDNPQREDRQNIAFIFACSATEQLSKPDDESDEVKWFAWNNLPDPEEIAFDHGENISLYRKYLSEGFALPKLG